MLGRIIITAALLLGLVSPGWATTRYVSKSGSDSYSGTSWSQAWATLAKINSSLAAGDTVYFGTGIWRGTTLSVIAGTSSDRTCYADSLFSVNKKWEGRRVAWIFGSDSLGGWTQYSGSVYRCSHTPTSSFPSLFQGDSLLWGQSSLASVNSAGKWYYSGGYVYAWIYGSGNPNSYDMEITARQCVNLVRNYYGQDYITFFGLGFKYGDVRIFSNNQDSNNDYSYVYIDHCYLNYAAGWGGVNPSLIYNDRPGLTTNSCLNNRVRACSLGTCYSFNSGASATLPQTEETAHGNCITFYSAVGFVIDSNVFFGHQSESALYFKCANDGTDGAGTYDTVRFNTFNCRSGLPYGIRIWGGCHDIQIYGNVISGANDGIQIGYFQLGFARTGYHVITNNTFYNCIIAVSQYDLEARGYTYAHRHNKFKYNVIYRSTASSSIMSLDSLTFWDQVDSNMYYTASGTSYFVGPGSTSNTYAQWQARSVDVRSTNGTNPSFNNATSGDFSRPSASTQMNLTYDGVSWTKYGAIQGAPSTTPHIALSPTSLTYSAVSGGSNPSNQTVSISNGGGGTLSWTAASGAGWLTISSASGTGAASITASVSISGLSAGTYSTNITFTATGADNTPQTVPVSLTISAADVTGPDISGVAGSGLVTSVSNTITWQTNEPATSQVAYGLTTSYGSTTTLDATLVTDHSVALSGLTSDTVYHFQVMSRDAAGNLSTSSDYTFRTPKPSSNLALGKTVTVCGTYSGYAATAINDGTVAASGGTSGTWASDQSTSDHWVLIDLASAYAVRSVRIYWAYNTGTSKYMRSLQYRIQYWNGSSYVDLATVNNPKADTNTYPDTTITYDSTGAPTGYSVIVAPAGDDPKVTTTGFSSVSTSRIRIYQPANQGPETYPTIMWLTEIEIYSEDIAPPGTL